MSTTETVERALPEEQQPDGELGESEIMAYEDAEQLAQEFIEIETATIDESTMRGTVKSINMASTGGTISIDIDVPTEPEPIRFHMDKPKPWSERSEFVRWLNKYGYGSQDIPLMIENHAEVEIERDGDEYELVTPPAPLGLKKHIEDVWMLLNAQYGKPVGPEGGVLVSGLVSLTPLIPVWLIGGLDAAVVTGAVSTMSVLLFVLSFVILSMESDSGF